MPFARFTRPLARRKIPYPCHLRPRGLARYQARSGSPAVMSATDPAFLAFLERQRAEYRASLPGRLADIELLWRQVLSGDASAQALATLERQAHSLAGSAATFGFAGLGDAARALELALNPLVGAAHALTPAAQADVSRALEALQRSLPGETRIRGA